MKTDKPTPIPKRREPKPLIMPANPPTLDERIENIVKRALYQLMRCEEEVQIVNMSFAEFETFWQRVMEEE